MMGSIVLLNTRDNLLRHHLSGIYQPHTECMAPILTLKTGLQSKAQVLLSHAYYLQNTRREYLAVDYLN